MYSLVELPGGPELLVIAAVIILFFGAKKLPELARGTGQALRIFKSESRGLADDELPTTLTSAVGAEGQREGGEKGDR